MKTAKCLKPFPYAHDGITVRTLAEGDVFECQDGVFDGLAAEGFIEEAEEGGDDTPAVIPENWLNLPDAEKLALGSRIKGKNYKDLGAAVKAIEAEVEKRATAAAQQ